MPPSELGTVQGKGSEQAREPYGIYNFIDYVNDGFDDDTWHIGKVLCTNIDPELRK